MGISLLQNRPPLLKESLLLPLGTCRHGSYGHKAAQVTGRVTLQCAVAILPALAMSTSSLPLLGDKDVSNCTDIPTQNTPQIADSLPIGSHNVACGLKGQVHHGRACCEVLLTIQECHHLGAAELEPARGSLRKHLSTDGIICGQMDVLCHLQQ